MGFWTKNDYDIEIIKKHVFILIGNNLKLETSQIIQGSCG
jgi:hypothetical protein